jgi:hypothetical protein
MAHDHAQARRDDYGMSRRMKYALIILEEGRGAGVMTSGRTEMCDQQAWINWQTALALERRGFVRLDAHDEGADVVMV